MPEEKKPEVSEATTIAPKFIVYGSSFLSALIFSYWVVSLESSGQFNFAAVLGSTILLFVGLFLILREPLRVFLDSDRIKGTFLIEPREVVKIQKEEAQNIVRELIDSREFKSAILEKIPYGKTPKEETQYIKFLLMSLEDKARVYEKKMNYFLGAATFFTVIFSGLIIFFGIQLVSSDTLGIKEATKDLVGNVEEIRKDLRNNDPGNRLMLLNDLGRKLDTFNRRVDTIYQLPVEREASLENLENILEEYKAIASDKIQNINEIIPLEIEKRRFFSKEIKTRDSLITFLRYVNDKINYVDEWSVTKDSIVVNLNRNTVLISNKLGLIDDQYYINEFLRRLAIGIIVVSFTLAIVRFCALQYKTNQQELIEIENDALLIRKTYVALQNTNDKDIVKSIYATFLQRRSFGEGKGELKGLDVNELIKTILDSIKDINGSKS